MMPTTHVRNPDTLNHQYAQVLGQRLRSIRKERGLYIREIAKITSLGYQAWTCYELGSRSIPLHRLNEYCGALEVRASGVLVPVEQEVFGLDVSTPVPVTVNLTCLARGYGA